MKYKIKINTFKNGRKEYIPFVKKGLFWLNLSYQGKIVVAIDYECPSRQAALQAIDLHFAGNNDVQTVEFEYISK